MAQRLDKQTRTQTRTQKRTSHKGEPALRSVRAEICRFLPGIALFLLAVLTFVPSMTNGFIWDDPAYVIDNQTLKSADGLWRIWTEPQSVPQYYPMVHTTFWLEARLWGTDRAPGYHIDNILLHALAVVLLWRALRAIDLPWPWLAAAIFAVHPVMVESVTWVTERKNVLSIVFYLLAFHAYCQSGRMNQSMASADTGSKQRQKRWYLFSLLLFLLRVVQQDRHLFVAGRNPPADLSQARANHPGRCQTAAADVRHRAGAGAGNFASPKPPTSARAGRIFNGPRLIAA